MDWRGSFSTFAQWIQKSPGLLECLLPVRLYLVMQGCDGCAGDVRPNLPPLTLLSRFHFATLHFPASTPVLYPVLFNYHLLHYVH